MASAILEVKDLTVRRHDGSIPVNGVSFGIQQGRTLGIIGESGAGKSTLALALMGLLDRRQAVISGSLVWQGRQLAGLSEREWLKLRGRQLAMVFQDPVGALDPAQRAARQVEDAIRRLAVLDRRAARQRAARLLAGMGVTPAILENSPYPFQLSGGLAQRVMIAIALAGDPGLLIADEPTSSLDVTSQAAIARLLKEHQKDAGLTMVFISHDLALVAAIADDILVMRAGEAVEYAPRQAVLDQPVHPYTAALIEDWRRYQQPGSERVASA